MNRKQLTPIIRQAVGHALHDYDQAAALSEDLYIIRADDHDAFCQHVADEIAEQAGGEH